MKKFLLTSLFILGAMLSFQSIGASNTMMSLVPTSMESDMQNIQKMKVKKVANKVMRLGVKLYAMGKRTMDKTMMSNGIKLYTMGMQMNGGRSMDRCKCMEKLKKSSS